MVIQTLISLVVLITVFCSAMLGMLVSRILPQNNLTAETKSVVTVSTGVVGTLTALVLGLLVAGAASSFNTRNEEVILIAADVIRVDRLLRRYGPEAESVRDLLQRYTAMKIQDLFPEEAAKLPSSEKLRALAMLEELQDRLATLDASTPNQRWLQSQALQLVGTIMGTRWLLTEQQTTGIALPLLALVVFWLSLLFFSFGLFAPRNATAILALFLCALAVAGAIEMTQDLNVPFQGVIRISSKPMKDALDEISLK
jgi:hypothetical protein